MSGQPTPGPWEVLGPIWKSPSNEPFYCVYAEDVQIVRLKLEANARLIAASPELYEAAKAIAELSASIEHDPPEEILALEQAIAKAEGRE